MAREVDVAAGLAAREGFQKMIVPRGNVREASLQKEIPVYGMDSLFEVVDFLQGKLHLPGPG